MLIQVRGEDTPSYCCPLVRSDADGAQSDVARAQSMVVDLPDWLRWDDDAGFGGTVATTSAASAAVEAYRRRDVSVTLSICSLTVPEVVVPSSGRGRGGSTEPPVLLYLTDGTTTRVTTKPAPDGTAAPRSASDDLIDAVVQGAPVSVAEALFRMWRGAVCFPSVCAPWRRVLAVSCRGQQLGASEGGQTCR